MDIVVDGWGVVDVVFWDWVMVGVHHGRAVCSAFVFPKAHVAGASGGVEVHVGVYFVQPGAAQIAKVGLALGAHHVIAAHCFLAGCVTGGAMGGVLLDVVFGGFFFGRELGLLARKAGGEFAVPGGFAYLAEGE